MNTNDLESLIRTILTEQLTPVTAPASCAIFASVDEAINAAHSA
ncbi:TPA: propanediol utilization protein, partial [Yersinia enterocolitica]|nr:propanediol utilization protein [Yersinia enterocolitica]